MVKLRRVENRESYPKKASDLLNLSNIPGWVELDLSGFSRTELVGTGLRNVKNSGIFIHPEDLSLLENTTVNFPIILSHSYGTSSKGTLTYRPQDLSTRELVSVPIKIIKATLNNIPYLSEIDKLADSTFKHSEIKIYTTGSNGVRGLIVPNRYYNLNEGRTNASIADFTCNYTSLLNLGKQSFIEKVEENTLNLQSCFNLLLSLISYNPKIRKEKDLKKEVLNELVKCIDEDLFGEKVTEELLKENLPTLQDLDESIFTSNPNIPVYTYHMYFTTYPQINNFLKLMGKEKEFGNNINNPRVSRNDEENIYIFRPELKDENDESRRKHILSILTRPQGQFKVGRAIQRWDDKLTFNSNGHLESVSSN